MTKENIIKLAQSRFDEAETVDRDNLDAAANDLEFATGLGQWSETEVQQRTHDGRPTLVINRMPQFIRQVTGDIRRTNPSTRVIPGDNDAKEETAEIIDGLIRAIEQDCDAASVYERAAESAATCGIGHWRVRADYEDDDSFNQTLFIESIPNPFAVRWDPAAKDPTRKDARFCFVLDEMPRERFEEEHPDAKADGWSGSAPFGSLATWFTGDTVTVAEYFWIESKPVTLYQLYDGTVTEEKPEMPELMVQQERKSKRDVVMWAKMTASEILEGPTEVSGKYIPVVSVVGEEINLGKTVIRSSVIRYAKDAQRMYNYWRTAQTELIALQPKAPYLVTPEQIAGHQKHWQRANVSNLPFLPYNPDERAGTPKRETPPIASQGMTQEVMLAADDMKATTGIYDAGLGGQGNETSGVAIRQRQMEGDVATSIYVDNLAKSIAHCGKIMVCMIPEVFDTTRVLRIVGKDEEAKSVVVNQPVMDIDGMVTQNDLRVGRYEVQISTGPNYTTQRQEAAESMTEFVRVFPQAAPLIGDLIAKNMDWPGADQIAERLKAMLPPGVAATDPDDPQAQQAQSQAQQAQQAQMQAQEQTQQFEARKAAAEAAEAEADAQKAGFEAELKKLELAERSGQMNEAIRQGVARGLVRPVRIPGPIG